MLYIPILKTTSSELKGYCNLEQSIKEEITPLFELTRDRTHKTHYPEGRLEVALQKALDAHPNGKMLLDLTSHEDLSNSEIEKLFHQDNGYENWTNFIKNTSQCDRLIPVIQIDADAYDDNMAVADKNIQEQVNTLIAICPKVALRANLDIEPDELLEFVKIIFKTGINSEHLIIIFDAEYIRPHTHLDYAEEILKRIKLIHNDTQAHLFVASASSFPKSVKESNYGDDEYGKFNIEEVYLHRELISKLPAGACLLYSDYASVHPVRYNTRGGSWVPRVDMPLTDQIYYYRYKRDAGGYKKAAAKVYNDLNFKKGVPSWGVDQIEKAKTAPEGSSPSHWIAVRVNIHLTTQLLRVQQLPKL